MDSSSERELGPRIQQTFSYVKVYFGDTLHLMFDRNDFQGLQSWKQAGKYLVELTFREGAEIVCEYDTSAKWRAVIALLDGFGDRPISALPPLGGDGT